MQHFFTLLIISILPFCHSLLLAADMQNEPSDFRGIPWGAALEQHQADLTFIRSDGDVAVYRRKTDSLKIGQADALKVAYRFYKGRFSAGIILTYGAENERILRSVLLGAYGKPEKPFARLEHFVWEGRDARIVLTCEITTYCGAEFISIEISAVELADGGDVPGKPKNRDDD